MNDFETMIRGMLASGMSPEDVAKQTGDILNKVQAETVKKNNGRKEALDKLEVQFHKHYHQERLTVYDAAALCVLVCADSFPDWGADEVAEFFSTMQKNIKTAASIVGKNPFEALFDVLGGLCDGEEDENKSKEKQPAPTKEAPKETPKKTAGADRKTQSVISSIEEDLAKLGDFLKRIGEK